MCHTFFGDLPGRFETVGADVSVPPRLAGPVGAEMALPASQMPLGSLATPELGGGYERRGDQ